MKGRRKKGSRGGKRGKKVPGTVVGEKEGVL